MEKGMPGEPVPSDVLKADGDHRLDQDGEMGLGQVDVERIEKVYRYGINIRGATASLIDQPLRKLDLRIIPGSFREHPRSLNENHRQQ